MMGSAGKSEAHGKHRLAAATSLALFLHQDMVGLSVTLDAAPLTFLPQAYTRAEKIAKLLDAAEELPMLVARDDDTTDEFRSALEGIAATFPEFLIAVQTFEQGPFK